MLNCLSNSMLIVDSDVTESRRIAAHVNEYQWHLAKAIIEKKFFHAKGEDRDAIYSLLDHAADRGSHTLAVVDSRSQKNFVTALNGQFFKGVNDLGEKGIGYFRNHNPEDAALA